MTVERQAYSHGMPEVNVQRALRLPPAPAFTAVREILEDIASGAGPWHDFALHIDLRDMGLPDLGYIAVPVRLETAPAREGTPTAVPVSVHAKRNPEAFPVFEGSVGAEGTGPSSSTLWLAGTYTAPMHELGTLLDATLVASVARRALQNFVDDLGEAAERKGERTEIERARYRIMDSGA